jgi:hypothetical protein
MDNDCTRLIVDYLDMNQQRSIVSATGIDLWRQAGLPCLLSFAEMVSEQKSDSFILFFQFSSPYGC